MKQHNTTPAGKTTVPKTSRREIQKRAKQEALTIGLDLGDRHTYVCILDEQGEVMLAEKITTTKTGLNSLFETLASTRVALEAGTHSPWVSRDRRKRFRRARSKGQ